MEHFLINICPVCHYQYAPDVEDDLILHRDRHRTFVKVRDDRFQRRDPGVFSLGDHPLGA